jgi:phosphoribosylanthranilate isomerase
MEIKICGLTNVDDACRAAEAGADFLGFVLYEQSPRGIPDSVLSGFRARLPAGVRVVAVVVNRRAEDVQRLYSELDLWAVQVHGDEQASAFTGVNARLWRAVRLEPGQDAEPRVRGWDVERFVVDAGVPGAYGGSGQCADWAVAARLAGSHRIMLAGGLTPSNVADAIRAVRPWGVDVASGVERVPGCKDGKKLRDFIRHARQASEP